jgi:hypothetical protein
VEFGISFFVAMSSASLFRRQHSLEDLQQLLAWYKIRDMLLGRNFVLRDVKKALKLAVVCELPNAVWLINMFVGRNIYSSKQARDVFLSCENDARALCFAALLGDDDVEVRQAADLGDALAQASMSGQVSDEERFQWQNLQLKENAMVFTGLGFAINMDKDVIETWKWRRRTM